MMRRALLGLVVGYSLLLAALWLGISRRVAVPPGTTVVPPPERAALIARLRALVDGTLPPDAATGGGEWNGFATVWCRGRALVRGEVKSRDGHTAVDGALAGSEALRALPPSDRAACRIKVDVLTGRAPIAAGIEPLFVLSLIAGVDGLGLQLPDREVLLLPDDLLAADLLAGHRPLPVPDLTLGLDARGAVRLLALRAGLDADAWRRTPHRLFRFRTESFIEPAAHDRPPLPVFRGNTPGPPLTRAALREAAVSGGAWLRDHQRQGGRFDYQYHTLADQPTTDENDYSLPRHAGAAYYLAQLHGATRDPGFREAARQALRHLAASRPAGCDRPDLACVGAPGSEQVDLGSSALALLAAAEYQHATGDSEFAPFARRLAAFLLAMQRPDGEFCHLYRPFEGLRDERSKLLYFSGEAAFALARLAHLTPEPRYIAAVDNALHYLTEKSNDTLAANFFYGEEHWTCIAVDEAWDLLPSDRRRERFADYCEGFGAFLRKSQFVAGEGPLQEQPDLLGSYGFSSLMPPHSAPVASRSEAMLSTLRLAERRGHAAEADALRAQVLGSLRFLLDHQVRDDNAWLMPDPGAARGGFLMSDVKRTIRIDLIQHACSALLRGEALAPPQTHGRPPPIH
ncbi:MAG: hypothetical protein EXR72_17645 [Myxococcales bacterium]|nr:hypothetical protein [Myxococcales bacterium]